METFRTNKETAHKKMMTLTPRQYVVVYLLARGRSYKQIARTLKISNRTVYAHAHNARDCVGAENIMQVVALMARSKE